MECICCGYQFNESRCGFLCSYCGYDNSIKGKKKVESYRSALLSGISGFTIKADKFFYNNEKDKFELSNEPHHLFENSLTGNELFGNIVWSKKWIANPSALRLEGKKCTIPISYVLGDKNVESAFDVVCANAENAVCHMGITIDENLILNILIGNKETTVANTKIKINWKGLKEHIN